MTSWPALALSAFSAVVAAGAVCFSYFATRQLEARSRREEVMRSLRWAAELAVSDDAKKSNVGVLELEALLKSEMLTNIEFEFVYAALASAIDTPRQAIGQCQGEVDVVVSSDADVEEEGPVSSAEGDQGEEAGDQ